MMAIITKKSDQQAEATGNLHQLSTTTTGSNLFQPKLLETIEPLGIPNSSKL